jgi:hypothetical protein
MQIMLGHTTTNSLRSGMAWTFPFRLKSRCHNPIRRCATSSKTSIRRCQCSPTWQTASSNHAIHEHKIAARQARRGGFPSNAPLYSSSPYVYERPRQTMNYLPSQGSLGGYSGRHSFRGSVGYNQGYRADEHQHQPSPHTSMEGRPISKANQTQATHNSHDLHYHLVSPFRSLLQTGTFQTRRTGSHIARRQPTMDLD